MRKCAILVGLIFLLIVNVVMAEDNQEEKYEFTRSIKVLESSDLPEHQQAKQAWQHNNVDSFRTLSIAREYASIELLDEKQNNIGTIDFQVLDDFEIMSLKGLSGTHITLKKNKALTFISVTDHVSGVSQKATFEPEVGWIKSNDAKLFIEDNQEFLILMLSTYGMFIESNNSNIVSRSIDSPADDTGIICLGNDYRGFGYGDSKSFCCMDAKQDANMKCWNEHCIGCCSFTVCDSLCFIGDYVCASCGITGRACSGSF
ncbi:MAG: hypothetical protein GY874_01060 [Desulfobacteraceae bacterium]|nr:hypothetical protein [Desulfobacteraceae bacterium]